MKPKRGHLRFRAGSKPGYFRVSEVLIVVNGEVVHQHDVFEGTYDECMQFMHQCFVKVKRAFVTVGVGAGLVVLPPALFALSAFAFGTGLYPPWWGIGLQWVGMAVMVTGVFLVFRERRLPDLEEPNNVIDLRPFDRES